MDDGGWQPTVNGWCVCVRRLVTGRCSGAATLVLASITYQNGERWRAVHR